ncbi:MAG: substrate-binding domain-containing protein [Actinomycetota bacterium]|nr:substrate-binding domain-containing protein [Actinomycetota bacterium]
MNNNKRRLVLAGLISFSLIAAACSDDEKSEDTTTTAASTESSTGDTTESTEAPMELAGGEVFVSGSSTVEPISVRVGELADELSGGELAVTVEGPGTGDGFKKFCAGESDISDASRPIKDEEAATCAEAGIEYVEIEVAIDGLTVATSPNNDAVTCLDFPAMYALVGPESEGFSNWNDAQALATELGSTITFPDADLTITGPGPESGTYDTFVEFVIAKIAKEREKDDTTRTDYTQSPNDNVIVDGIEGTDTSLGWVGYAFYSAEADKMKAIEIDKGDGCVAPTEETIADGSYPLSRSLFIYVSKQSLADNPAVASYVSLYLSDEGLAMVSDAGYVDLPAERIAASRSAWEAAQA